MSSRYTSLAIHLVFATQNRMPWVLPAIEHELWNYLVGAAERAGCHVHAVGGIEDHVHVLVELQATQTVAAVVKSLKGSSSRWMSTRPDGNAAFAWQEGYGAFAVSRSGIPRVAAYIASQRAHHARRDFDRELHVLAGVPEARGTPKSS